MVYVLVIHLPADGVQSFQRYEAAVLPLLSEHHGRLDRRLRSADAQTEVHLVSFPSVGHFESYRNDPRRAAELHLPDEAHARIEFYELIDVRWRARGRKHRLTTDGLDLSSHATRYDEATNRSRK